MCSNFLKKGKGRFSNTEIIRSSDNRTADHSKGRFQGIKEAHARRTQAFCLTRKERTLKRNIGIKG